MEHAAQPGPGADTRFQAFFNRGFVISQFMAHYLAEKHLTPKQFKQGIQSQDEQAIRTFLSGQLRPALLEQLQSASSEGGEVHGRCSNSTTTN